LTVACAKIGYWTRAEALDAIKMIKIDHRYRSKKSGKDKKTGRKLRAYQCHYCGWWHLTTAKKKKGKK